MAVIRTRDLSKKYHIYRHPGDKLREWVTRGNALHREFWALRDLTFEVESGTTLGIIGPNGSGKSTLLQILAGIMRQSRGDCFVEGKVSALLELGSGFNPEFTGRENVYMNGAILGMETLEMRHRFEAIARFAEIGDFMDQPVKTYSSGMFMRLSFAVAINVDPDILLVDEALSVGDLVFQHRCMHRMNRLKEEGKTIILVTHDLGAITRFCDRAILLDQGELRAEGTPDTVVQKYRALVFERERRYQGVSAGAAAADELKSPSVKIPSVSTIPNIDHRFGSGGARILGIDLLDSRGNSTREVFGGQGITVRISAQFARAVDKPILGFTLRDRLGVEVSACNSTHAGHLLPPIGKDQVITCDFLITLPKLTAGSYSLSPAVAAGELLNHDMCDWIDNALVFSIRSESLVYGAILLEAEVRHDAAAPSDASDHS